MNGAQQQQRGPAMPAGFVEIRIGDHMFASMDPAPHGENIAFYRRQSGQFYYFHKSKIVGQGLWNIHLALHELAKRTGATYEAACLRALGMVRSAQ